MGKITETIEDERFAARIRRRAMSRLPHHGRGGSEHVGRTRKRLAKILEECLGIVCEGEDLRPSQGRCRNNTTIHDCYAWEVFAMTKSGHPFIAGSFDTMTECVKAGAVEMKQGEISALWRIVKKEKGDKDEREIR